jgi:sugar phosphate permease
MEKQANFQCQGTNSARSSHDVALGRINEVKDAALYRKVDWHIMPLMFLCYFLQFLDKVLINYAKIMGMEKSLGMKGQDFSWMATGFFIAYALAEFPQSFLLQKFPVSKVLGCNVLLWGIILCCTSAAQNYAGMGALRALLGAFESIITPALVLITTQWYTKRQACPRTGIWYCGLGMGQSELVKHNFHVALLTDLSHRWLDLICRPTRLGTFVLRRLANYVRLGWCIQHPGGCRCPIMAAK